jgi:inorganic phosphate transporter, PiT family
MEVFSDLSSVNGTLLVLAVGCALGFEFVNGFHDTANAVATVIYTNTLKPTYAVIWSGLWNLVGVLTSSGAVAFGIIALLPTELVNRGDSVEGLVMVFAIIIAAIIWNLGTWYFGLPVSSSHTLVGTILGVSLANSMLHDRLGEGVNWIKVKEVFSSLLISPAIGFIGAGLLLLVVKQLIKTPELYQAPEDKAPPLWIRILLIFTCTGVSFAHGSNDGQKGMGLVVLILIGLLPNLYAIDLELDPHAIVNASQSALVIIDERAGQNPIQPISNAPAINDDRLSAFLAGEPVEDREIFTAIATKTRQIDRQLADKNSLSEIPVGDRAKLRQDIYAIDRSIAKSIAENRVSASELPLLTDYRRHLNKAIDFIPLWVKIAVATALGIGTTIGWKRIVVTVGEKIGAEPLNYAQGAISEIIAMSTITIADRWGLPVSTTHVLSSGVAGTMAANRSGLQSATLRNLLLAWVLTLPVCVLLGWGIFSGLLAIVSRVNI